jgi:hypothetical protein
MAFGTLAMKGAKAGSQVLDLLKRSPESRACIDNKKAQGISGRQARRECKKQFGSRLGNAGRQLGILPAGSQGVSVSQFLQKQSIKNTPSQMGTVNEFAIPSYPSGAKTAGGNYMTVLLLGLGVLLFANRKIFGF